MMHYDQLFVFGWDSNRIQAPTISWEKSSWTTGVFQAAWWANFRSPSLNLFEGGLVWWNFLSWPYYYIIPVNSLVPSRSNLESSIAENIQHESRLYFCWIMMRSSLCHRIYSTIIYIYICIYIHTQYISSPTVYFYQIYPPPFGWITPRRRRRLWILTPCRRNRSREWSRSTSLDGCWGVKGSWGARTLANHIGCTWMYLGVITPA